MRQRLRSLQRFVLFVTPLIASSALATALSQAATFALSEGESNFTNINQQPLELELKLTPTPLPLVIVAMWMLWLRQKQLFSLVHQHQKHLIYY
ncbi:hypothetical protein [Scytonema sp. PCC 10023]|uniref:hypothetical protein n=1 Tax=Scytonema sp. PCC 10023 TaxID=1680591 RepID=UPI0039C6F28E